jgi:hypothetical protein
MATFNWRDHITLAAIDTVVAGLYDGDRIGKKGMGLLDGKEGLTISDARRNLGSLKQELDASRKHCRASFKENQLAVKRKLGVS